MLRHTYHYSTCMFYFMHILISCCVPFVSIILYHLIVYRTVYLLSILYYTTWSYIVLCTFCQYYIIQNTHNTNLWCNCKKYVNRPFPNCIITWHYRGSPHSDAGFTTLWYDIWEHTNTYFCYKTYIRTRRTMIASRNYAIVERSIISQCVCKKSCISKTCKRIWLCLKYRLKHLL